jgi:DNA-directed RNA polymerase subunit RPC12/RpoP
VTLESLSCSHCGAPLEVPPGVRYATCAHCGSRLAIHRTGTAAYTEVLEEIRDRTARMAEDLGHIRLQNELERLDREWEARRAPLMTHGKDGSVNPPSAAGGLLGGLLAGGFGIFWLVMAFSMGAPPFFLLFGVAFIGLALAGGIYTASRAQEYSAAEQEYRRQRVELLGQMRDRESATSHSS